MAKPFDATTKELLEKNPRPGSNSSWAASWARCAWSMRSSLPRVPVQCRQGVGTASRRDPAGNIATFPLAPIARVSATELPAVIKRMEERIESEADPHEIADIWAATYLLMGLIYPETLAKSFFKEFRRMRESATYQAILREGKAEGKAEGKLEEARSDRAAPGPDQVRTPEVPQVQDPGDHRPGQA